MATLREIRRRISGVKSTQKLTKAMKMIAAAKLRRAQDNIISARPYAKKMNDLLRHLVTKVNTDLHPLLNQRESQKILLVLITGDRGLCGAFNTNVIKKTLELIDNKYKQNYLDKNLQLICIGKKGYPFFSKKNYQIFNQWLGVFQNLKFESAQDIVNCIKNAYIENKFDRVEIIYNEFKSVIQQRVIAEQFLPIPPEEYSGTEKHAKSQVDYIYEPNVKEIIDNLLHKHLNTQFWRILLESNAAEQGARMSAMDNANENAKELLDTLNRQYNKARQTSITTEILEITSGANALKGS
jgi:F-type H+-transporting ATPase subunit gamma